MPAIPVQIAFLIVCWITALVTLVIFLESWFALTRRFRLEPATSGGDSGLVSILVPVRGTPETVRRTVESVLAQSYAAVELFLIYSDEEVEHEKVVRDFSALRSRVTVRPLSVPFRLDSPSERVRALELAQSNIRGSWILVVEADVVLEPHAVESALEFVRDQDITALGLTPGIECRSFVQKLVGPSLEWFVRMMQVVDRGREQSGRGHPAFGFMLLHGHTHSVINRMNRMPGILNESGWTLWSYRVEGFRTFQGDGSGWIFREATPRSLLSRLEPRSPLNSRRVPAFLLGSAVIAMVSAFGVLFGLLDQGDGFLSHGILYLSAFSYSLMATSYFFYSRRLKAATWFAPFWFISHCWALALTVIELGRSQPTAPDLTAMSGRRSEVSSTKK